MQIIYSDIPLVFLSLSHLIDHERPETGIVFVNFVWVMSVIKILTYESKAYSTGLKYLQSINKWHHKCSLPEITTEFVNWSNAYDQMIMCRYNVQGNCYDDLKQECYFRDLLRTLQSFKSHGYVCNDYTIMWTPLTPLSFTLHS